MLLCNRTPGCRKLEGHRSPCTVPVAPKPAVTAPDVRTAAQAEAEQRWRRDAGKPWHRVFVSGAVWGAALVTPTREQIAEALYSNHPRAQTRSWDETPRLTREIYLEDADAVLALSAGLKVPAA